MKTKIKDTLNNNFSWLNQGISNWTDTYTELFALINRKQEPEITLFNEIIQNKIEFKEDSKKRFKFSIDEATKEIDSEFMSILKRVVSSHKRRAKEIQAKIKRLKDYFKNCFGTSALFVLGATIYYYYLIFQDTSGDIANAKTEIISAATGTLVFITLAIGFAKSN